MSAFSVLNSIDCGEHIEQKSNLSYLSWVWAWGELKKRYPKSFTTVYESPEGMNYFTDGKTCWVKTGVTVVDEEGNEQEHIEYLPVMDNRNKSITLETLVSTDVNKAIQRSLTKAIARHGLGLYIYAGEDLPETLCDECGTIITSYVGSNGKLVSVADVVKMTKERYGKALCTVCGAKAKAAAIKTKTEGKVNE